MALDLENATASIKHLNIRKEGPDDEKVLAVDMKLEVKAAAEDVLPYFDPALRGMLFDINENVVRFPMMGPVHWSGSMEHMELELFGLCFRETKLSKFVFEPRIEREQQTVTMTVTASFQPEGGEVATLAECVQESALLAIHPQPGLFDER